MHDCTKASTKNQDQGLCFFFFTARIGWICKCLLNASVKRIRAWKALMIGSQAKIAIGPNRTIPIPLSNSLASARVKSHTPVCSIFGLTACAIWTSKNITWIKSREKECNKSGQNVLLKQRFLKVIYQYQSPCSWHECQTANKKVRQWQFTYNRKSNDDGKNSHEQECLEKSESKLIVSTK